MNLVTIATFDEPDKAEPLRKRFADAGVHAEVHDESRYEWFWLVAKPIAGFKLKVGKKDFENALRLLKEWDATAGVLRDAVRCPQCHSSRVEYPQLTRKFLTPNLVGIGCALRLFDKEFYCQECENTWPKDVRVSPPRKHSA